MELCFRSTGRSTRVPEHPAFLSSPSHLDQCASLQSHHVWVIFSRSVWRWRLQTSSDPGLLLLLRGSGMPRCFGSCTEVSKPRGSCHSDACTVRWDSPTWPGRSPRIWRSSASLNHFSRQVRRNRVKPLFFFLNLPSLSKSFPPLMRMRSLQVTLPTPSNCRVYTTAQLHKSEPIRAEMLRDAVTSPGQTAA